MPDMAASARYRRHALEALRAYWETGAQHVADLTADPDFSPDCTQPAFALVPLPEWAADLAPDGGLLVPAGCVKDLPGASWEHTDWLLAAFHLLECTPEREFERRHGPIHSYSFRLRGWDQRVWSRAWVNRIALFLRRWAARRHGGNEADLFGPLPKARIVLTHDVDAIGKTLQIRLKQGAFNLWKSLASVARGELRTALSSLSAAARFLFSRGQYDHLVATATLAKEHGLESTFNFFAGKQHAKWLFDPAYEVGDRAVKARLQELARRGCSIGLHQSFDASLDAGKMETQRRHLELAVEAPVTSCRQHWLRFSWRKTWSAQSEAGLNLDMTLGYNDRPGFRAAAALQWTPWDAEAGAPHRLEAMPLLFMDSHFYDYQMLSGPERRAQLRQWLDEVQAVGGVASVLWHPHSFDRDYGWRDGFMELLQNLERVK